jgi:hypothetical protein
MDYEHFRFLHSGLSDNIDSIERRLAYIADYLFRMELRNCKSGADKITAIDNFANYTKLHNKENKECARKN